MHILINSKYLTYDNHKTRCSIGKKGIGYKKKEGDLLTPVGQYKIKYVLYRRDRVKNLKSKLKKKIIKKNMGWCDDPKSSKYNTLITLPFDYSHERLFKKNNIYDIILVLNYNIRPVRKNRGSAIFIHVARGNYEKTKGCVAIKKKDLLKLINKIDSRTKVKIVSQK